MCGGDGGERGETHDSPCDVVFFMCSEGESVTYTLLVTNNGPQSSTGAVLEDFSFNSFGCVHGVVGGCALIRRLTPAICVDVVSV